MVRAAEPGIDWVLIEAVEGGIPTTFHPVLDAYLDLQDRERNAGIMNGTPILVSPEFSWDRGLALYFNTSPKFLSLKASTKLSDAREIKGWLTYLDAPGVHWLFANEEHYARYRRLRTDEHTVQKLIDRGDIEHEPGTPLPVVSEASFEKTHAALTRLYDWAIARGMRTGFSPVPAENRDRRHAARSRERKDTWMLPGAYRLWRDIGLAGRGLARDPQGRLVATTQDPSWKGGVVASRNLAFANLIAMTGLRMQAATTLLSVELPDVGADARVASAVGKFGRGYTYTPLPVGLAEIDAYMRFGRAAAVQRAQRNGRYRLERAIVIERISRTRHGVVLTSETGEVIEVDRADEAQRRRLYIRTEAGPEPMMLWLTAAGTPVGVNTFQAVFDAANARVLKAFNSLGAPETPPDVNPHMLRFSFALWVLVALHKRIDEERGYSPYDTYDQERYGAAYATVQTLLGHKNEETTVDTYLVPVKRLRQATLFDSTVGMDLESLIGYFTRDSQQMVRVGAEPGGA